MDRGRGDDLRPDGGDARDRRSIREFGSGTGRGYGINAAYRENNINSSESLTRRAVELAAEAAEIVGRCSSVDAERALLKRPEDAG
ncbi:hypothetical protein [Embleya scabrispora]|uniref:hypothetical protein n=1 Tax=Embleya scabrispora TaxID=159449 RepID=UPI00037DE771|nr:hypothetical protein [Embleya scabrispora]MYS80284.1 hypothetical protein [Streptomyces sp. SID5474]